MKRLLTGTIYIVFLALCYALKVWLHQSIFFDITTYAFTLVGTFEILRAFDTGVEEGKKISACQKGIVWCFAALYTPLYLLSEKLFDSGVFTMLLFYFIIGIALLVSLVVSYEKTSLEGTGKAFMACFYPTGLASFLLFGNHLDNWLLSCYFVLFIYVISPCADCFAYLFGKYMRKKFPKKMAPVVSPNKTVIGCVGGLLGGAAGGAVLYAIFAAIHPDFLPMGSYLWSMLFSVMLGFVGSFITEIGDLAESAIKRKVGLKDIGNLLPGHGGILDRIDGSLLLAFFTYAAFVLISL